MIHLLKQYFGYDSFRPLQQDIIQHVLQGGDAIALMPTGGGKSICYQLTALMLPGVTLVVSPLISLMTDQVQQLRANGICAAAMNSASGTEELTYIRRHTMDRSLKLLYLSPERLLSDLPQLSREMDVSLFAIDEAHCISQWGHDFRPEYTQMAVLKENFPKTPILALTATADKVTRMDILKQLRIPEAKVFVSSFDRPNLSLDVRRGYDSKSKRRAILDIVQAHADECGIIYCLSRKNTEAVAQMLQLHGITAAVYHAGLPADERERTQSDFVNDRLQVICATIAFGMGINKSNVRYVIHYNLPKSIESYYQEIGRAGRDGLPADTILFFDYQDVVQLRSFADESGQKEINNERLNRMVEYAEAQVCRRRILLNYFGESSSCDCGNCDVCAHPPKRFDGTVLVQKALSVVVRTKEQVSLRTVVDILRGIYSPEVRVKGYASLPTFAVGRDVPITDWNDYLQQMLQMGFLEIAYDDNFHLRLTPLGREVLYGRAKAQLSEVRYEEPKPKEKKGRKTKADSHPMLIDVPERTKAVEDKRLFERLRQRRLLIAQKQGFPPYVVLSDKTLHALATARPGTEEEFGRINGIGEYKKKKYAEVFIQEIKRYIEEQQ